MHSSLASRIRFAGCAATATIAFALAQAGRAAPQGPCDTSQVVLNTGYDHLNGGVLATGSIDPRWTVVSDPFAGTVEPRPATVIVPSSAWKPAQPQSMWISGYPDSIQSTNGAYVFETSFCLKPTIDLNDPNARLEIAMRADDACTAFLNGSAVPFHIGEAFNSTSVTTSSYPLGTLGAVVGSNTLRIQVDNLYAVAMGLNLVATVYAAPNNSAEKPECCNGNGALQGYKFDDLDGDGVHDFNEPLIPGWQIVLWGANGLYLTTTTDSEGYYSFIDLPPSSYKLGETPQPGWIQTYPTSGFHDVVITGIEGTDGLAFGNQYVGVPLPYCPPGPTSEGCIPDISGTREPDISHVREVWIRASNLPPNRSGVIFFSRVGPQSVSWCGPGTGNSFLCLRAPTTRTGAQNTGGMGGCDGTMFLDWSAYQIATGGVWSAGDKAWVQGWFRSPGDCKTTFLTEALELTYQ